METLFAYSVKVAIAIVSFYLFYYLVLRRRKDFRFNRIYLGSSFLLSFLIPLITFQIVRHDSRPLVLLPEQTATDVLPAVPVSAGPDVMTWIFYGFLMITAFFVVRLIAGYLRAHQIVRNCRVSEMGGIRIHVSEEEIHPFTFFRKIVVPGSILNHPDQHIILKHEMVHVQEKHTLDILSSEILFLLQWFNPFALMLKAAIRNNLEFLTDQEVLQQHDMQRYQLAMVALAGKKGTIPFLNALNGSDLKNRIIMMKQKTENKSNFSRRLMVIPLLTILIAGLSNKEFTAAPLPEQSWKMSPEFLPEADIQVNDSAKKKKEEVVVIGYPAKSTKVWSISKADPGNAAGTAKMVTGVQLNSGDTLPGKGEVKVIGYGIQKGGNNFTGDSLKVRIRNSGNQAQPLYILDGTEIASPDVISPENIESISVLKNESATALYGMKGKNGVIIITSKKKDNHPTDPLLLIDGKESSKKVKDIDPEEIQSVSVWKGEKAAEKYGRKGENGVIEIVLKQPAAENSGDITSVDNIRKHIAQNILYPVQAQKNGEQGSVRIYAYINGSGKITQITETKPKGEIRNIDEVVVVGYGSSPGMKNNGKQSEALKEEAALCVKNLPDLHIPDLKNSWVAFDFKFVLQ